MRQPSEPTLRLPAHAADCHVHVFGPASKFPFSPKRGFTPADASKDDLFALHKHLGIERCVIVQTAVHGEDNSVVEDAIRHGDGNYLGIALVPVNVADSELARLASAGFRGVRFNFMKHLPAAASIEQIIDFTERLANANLHLQVHFESSLIHDLAPHLAKSKVPVVIDHMARVDASRGSKHADFAALCEVLRHPLFTVKVSGVDRIATDRVDYDDGVALAKLLVDEFPDQCVWGSDWPHPNHHHIPDDGKLVDAIARIAPDASRREKLMVTNPQNLYRFA